MLKIYEIDILLERNLQNRNHEQEARSTLRKASLVIGKGVPDILHKAIDRLGVI